MEPKIIYAGDCWLCGMPIDILAARGLGITQNVFLCKKCSIKVSNDKEKYDKMVEKEKNHDKV